MLEIVKELRTSITGTRRALTLLVEEEIVIVSDTTPVCYGFVGFECTDKSTCKDHGELCMIFAHKCPKYLRMMEENDLRV